MKHLVSHGLGVRHFHEGGAEVLVFRDAFARSFFTTLILLTSSCGLGDGERLAIVSVQPASEGSGLGLRRCEPLLRGEARLPTGEGNAGDGASIRTLAYSWQAITAVAAAATAFANLLLL